MTRNIDELIEEYNKEISVPKKNLENNDSIRVLAITGNRFIGFKAEIAHILNVNIGDEILYILDANGRINVRKSPDKLILGHNEKFISLNKISEEGRGHFKFKVPIDILRILKIRDKERLVWILDDKNNVLIISTILPEQCTFNGILLDISSFSFRQVSIPTSVRDLLLVDAGDIIVYSVKNDNIIVNSFTDIDKLINVGMGMISTSLQAHLSKSIENFINPKDHHLLWILDIDGDIILRNTFLPKICI